MRKPLLPLLALLLVTGAFPHVTTAQVKAFPSAEGFGATETVGGRGGAVIAVTNLNDSGPGSFRACAEGTGPRTCVFRVGGIIRLNQAINIAAANSYLTIAGQTAPGEGITITPWPINIAYGAHDVILRHVRHRQAYPNPPADGNNACGGIIVYGPGKIRTHHIMIDHASVAWSCDDSTQASGYVTDITFQWSLIGEGYEAARGDPYGSAKGFIVGGNQDEAAKDTISFHHNLLLHTGSRNPGGGPYSVLDWRYNLGYNSWVYSGNMRLGGTDNNVPTDKPAHTNFVGNLYLAGPETNMDGYFGELRQDADTKVYVQDNETPWCRPCPADSFALGWMNGSTGEAPASAAQFRASTPFAAPPITPTSLAALENVLSQNAGATKPKRDALDTRLLAELKARGGDMGRKGAPFPTLPSSTAAPVDSDSDGMPDAWETAHGLDPRNAADRNGLATNGYTNLENYLNELAGDTISVSTPPVPPSPPPISARPIYLSTGGHDDSPSDSGDCTAPENIRTPRATLASALACMKVPGKALYIRGGTYAGMISTEGGAIRGGLTADTPTRIEGYQAEPVTIQLPVGGINAVELNGISNMAVQNITVDAMARAESNALACMHSSNLTIKNSVFRNAFYEVAYFNGCNQVTITQSHFQGALNGAAIILASDSTGITFDEIDVSTSALGGIETHPNRQTTNLTITRSQFRDTGKGAGGAAIDLGPGKGARIIGNMFDHNQAGIRVRQGVRDATLTDLMMASTAGAALQCDPGSSLTLKNIVTFSNGDDRKGECLAAVKKTGKGQ